MASVDFNTTDRRAHATILNPDQMGYLRNRGVITKAQFDLTI